MRKILSLIIIALTLYSFADTNEQKTNKIRKTEQPELLVDTVEIGNKMEGEYLKPYLEIAALNKDWPATSATDEINWQTDSVSQSYTRKDYPLGILTERASIMPTDPKSYIEYGDCWIEVNSNSIDVLCIIGSC